MEKLIKKIKINTTIELLSGLHVGGSKENVQIGGIDNPVIRTGEDNQPYIPGSSLKGKMRCLLEQIYGIPEVGGGRNVEFVNKTDECKSIINLFGFADDKKPSKLIVRDAMLTPDSAERLRNCENLDMPYTEGKWENFIDRVKGTAEHPRQTERIPAGVSFDVEFVINVWNDDNADDLLKLLKKGINALENDYLGGSGSRGYGQIQFGELRMTELSESNNWKA
ncbi:MAG: type III-A CRISPR-associated RAMP protein Csm3 [Paludibacteraceae bacterium]|nr:type III-A CRISPR-associated RAMP protein Csm3 [Paludibacteraceae bacterium]